MYNFHEVILRNSELNPDFIVRRKMKSTILPELPGANDIEKIGALLKESQFEAWTFGYGAAESHVRSRSIDVINSLFAKNIFNNNLILFSGSNLFLWAPQDHEYFVIFGDLRAVKKTLDSGIFDYDFSEYVQDPDLGEKTKQFLLEMQRKYTIG